MACHPAAAAAAGPSQALKAVNVRAVRPQICRTFLALATRHIARIPPRIGNDQSHEESIWLLPAMAVVALLSHALQAAEPLTVGSLFTDHAVLQRDMVVPVWGKAEPGREVVVQFAGQEKQATADKDGRLDVAKLDPMAASATGRNTLR